MLLTRGQRTTLCLYGISCDTPTCMFYPNTKQGREYMKEFIEYYSFDEFAVWSVMVIRVPYSEIKSCHVMHEVNTKKFLANLG